jgi:phosphoribosylaminoimidazole-succinocarboxamide synthase
MGTHDENIGFAEVEKLLGTALAAQVRDTTLRLYKEAAEYALTRGIIIADTKFEFGLDAGGKLYWIDEALTPDSSRFWPLDSYREGESPPSFDKQFIRNWLESTGWNKKPPAPEIPTDIAQKTAEKHREVLLRLTRDSSGRRRRCCLGGQ